LGFIALVLFIGIAIITCENSDNNVVNNNNGDNTTNNDNDKKDPFDISAMDFVGNMRVGWNWGNQFDAAINSYSNSSVTQIETSWSNIAATKGNVDALKNAGFDIIRIPVSWKKVADPAKNYKIRDDWMIRITQVVDWAYENDMYVILNTHHDSGADHSPIFRFYDSNVDESLETFRLIWEQIAENFKYYEEKLIFEPLNEPRSGDWNGTPEQYRNINKHYQVFVDTVRATGENNAKRFFLFNTYAASAGALAMNGLVLPDDPAKDKHIVSYHAYVPNNFAFGGASGLRNTTVSWSPTGSDATAITTPMDRFFNKFVKEGIPVIIGETGATNKNNTDARRAWAEFYAKSGKDRGMPIVIWDNYKSSIPANGNNDELYGLLNRATSKFNFPEIIEGLMKGSEKETVTF